MKESVHGNFFVESDSYHTNDQDYDRFIWGWRTLEFGWIANEQKIASALRKHFVVVLPWFRYEIMHINMKFANEYLHIGPFSMKVSIKSGDSWAYLGRTRLW